MTGLPLTSPTRFSMRATAACVAMLTATGLILGAGALSSVTASFDETSPWSVSSAVLWLALLGSGLVWAVGVVVILMSRSWSNRQTTLLIALWPLAVAVTVIADQMVSTSFAVNALLAMVQVLAALLAAALTFRFWLWARKTT